MIGRCLFIDPAVLHHWLGFHATPVSHCRCCELRAEARQRVALTHLYGARHG